MAPITGHSFVFCSHNCKCAKSVKLTWNNVISLRAHVDDNHSLFGGIVCFIEHFYNCVHIMYYGISHVFEGGGGIKECIFCKKSY